MSTYKGFVQRGAQRGKALGFPTANIFCADTEVNGIYAARVTIKGGDAPYMAAVYRDEKRGLLEAHLLDFSDDLYGIEISIELYKKIREAAAFENEKTLKDAIADDVAKVREYFKN